MKEELRKKMGAVLRLERERLSIDREELAEQLKITDSYLERIEQGTSEGLPSDIYFELFAKSYAEAIGVDYAATTEALRDEIGATMAPADADKSDAKGKPDAGTEEDSDDEESVGEDEPIMRQLKKLGILLGAVVGILIIFVVAYKLFWSDDNTVADDQSTTEQEQSEQSVTGDKRAHLTNYDWEVPSYEPPSPLVLKLRARDASWSTVLADGDTVIFRGLGAGREYVITANYRLQVSIALPRMVETELNGKIVDLRDPDSRRISRVMIDQLNVEEYLNANPGEEPKQGSPRPTPSPAAQQPTVPAQSPTPPAIMENSDSTKTADSADTTKGGTVEL